ncbi:MAG: dockerin type I domain-containing protein [Phycisphaerae bacterium]
MPTTPRRRAAALCAAALVPFSAVAQTGFVHWETPHVNPIALTPSGATLLAVNTADNRLEIFDLSRGGIPESAGSVPVGLDPVSVRARSETEVWVVNHVSDSISVVDLATRRVVRTLPVGDEPCDVVFAGTPQRAFVSVSQLNQVRVFNPLNLAAAPVILSIQGEDPRALAISPDGSRVYAAIFESGNKTTSLPIPVVSQAGSPYNGQNPPPNFGLQFSPPIDPLLPAPPAVSLIVRKNASNRWMDDNSHDWTTFVPWDLHDHDVAIIDTASLAVTYASGLMTSVMNLSVRPDGVVTAIGTEALNEVRFEPVIQAVFLRVTMSSFDPAAPANVSTIDLNPHLDYAAHTAPQATRDLSIGDPRGVVWSAGGDRAFVSGMGSNNVIVLDAAGNRITQIDCGEGPTGLALGASGALLYVLNKFEATISVIDTASNAEIARTPMFDPTPGAIKQGRPFLYDTHRTSGLGHISCASCHIDGRNDGLAWDLGNPDGALKTVNQVCRQGPNNCRPWHPMKGPMITQTLVSIVGVEPLHWRGDRESLAAFSGAFTGLQGMDAEPTPAELQEMTDFLATVRYSPSPNRNLDDSLPTALPVSGGTGNAANGLTLYQTAPLFGGALRCTACHPLPTGTDRAIDSPGVGPAVPQSLKDAQLRALNEKVGFSRASLTNNRGFGYDHDSDRDNLGTLLTQPPFTFPPGPPGVQQRRDMEALLLSFTDDTHAAVGQQVTFDGANNGDAVLLARLNTFIAQANVNRIGLVARQRRGGLPRGFVYVGANVFLSDRVSETSTAAALLASAAPGGEVTYTAVPIGTQVRIGVDRDADGFFDRDELDAGADPANPASNPTNVCLGDFTGDRTVNESDLGVLLAHFGATVSGTPATGDVNGDGAVDSADLGILLARFGAVCP